MQEFRRYRTLKTLAEAQGWLTRWKLTRKSLDHMDSEVRENVLESLKSEGFIEQRTAKKEEGAGAPALQYRITKTGLKEYRKLASASEDGVFYSETEGSPLPPAKLKAHSQTGGQRF